MFQAILVEQMIARRFHYNNLLFDQTLTDGIVEDELTIFTSDRLNTDVTLWCLNIRINFQFVFVLEMTWNELFGYEKSRSTLLLNK